jgi:hypothetical protein
MTVVDGKESSYSCDDDVIGKRQNDGIHRAQADFDIPFHFEVTSP